MEDVNEQRLERLMSRLPKWLQTTVQRLRRPELRWLRVPAGVLFILGGFLSILPIFGLWMLPIGLVLLSDDVALLRRLRNRILDWIQRHRPRWLEQAPR